MNRKILSNGPLPLVAAVLAALFACPLPAEARRKHKDLDGDGIPNISDRDVDGDGIRNRDDTNVDGAAAVTGPPARPAIGDTFLNGAAAEHDIDDDGLQDIDPEELDMDGDRARDDQPREEDIDGDTFLDDDDGEEDIDGDNLNDTAATEQDMDGDGRPDNSDKEKDIDGDARSDAGKNEFDTDGDGTMDDEITGGIKSRVAGTTAIGDADDDGDGLDDVVDFDDDGDGRRDSEDSDHPKDTPMTVRAPATDDDNTTTGVQSQSTSAVPRFSEPGAATAAGASFSKPSGISFRTLTQL